MNGITDPLLFVLAVVILLGVPGPTNTLLATAGATTGIRRAIRLVPVETFGYLVAILIYEWILGPFIFTSAPLFVALRLAVSSYLLWVAYELWSINGTENALDTTPVTPRRLFIATVLNPKGAFLALTIIPGNGRVALMYLLAFTCLSALLAVGWIMVGAAIGAMPVVNRQKYIVPRAGAVVLGIFTLFFVSSMLVH